MFLVSLEKWEDLVNASLAKMGWTCHCLYYSPNTEVTLLTDTAPLASADSSVCNPCIRGTVGEGRKDRLGPGMRWKAHQL